MPVLSSNPPSKFLILSPLPSSPFSRLLGLNIPSYPLLFLAPQTLLFSDLSPNPRLVLASALLLRSLLLSESGLALSLLVLAPLLPFERLAVALLLPLSLLLRGAGGLGGCLLAKVLLDIIVEVVLAELVVAAVTEALVRAPLYHTAVVFSAVAIRYLRHAVAAIRAAVMLVAEVAVEAACIRLTELMAVILATGMCSTASASHLSTEEASSLLAFVALADIGVAAGGVVDDSLAVVDEAGV
jgi:hypothetical protein